MRVSTAGDGDEGGASGGGVLGDVAGASGADSVELFVYDVAGSSLFRDEITPYCEGANFVVFVYDVTDASSLEALGEWIPRLQVIWITCCVSFCLLGCRPRRSLHSIFTPLAAQALYD